MVIEAYFGASNSFNAYYSSGTAFLIPFTIKVFNSGSFIIIASKVALNWVSQEDTSFTRACCMASAIKINVVKASYPSVYSSYPSDSYSSHSQASCILSFRVQVNLIKWQHRTFCHLNIVFYICKTFFQPSCSLLDQQIL